MKYQNPSAKNLKISAALIGGIIVGGMLSNGAIALVHTGKAVTEEDKKKENNMLTLKRLGLAGASAYGASGIVGTDALSTFAQGALYGMSGVQALKAVEGVAKTNETVSAAVSGTTKAKIFLQNAIGLACPCNEMSLAGYRRKRKGMKGLPAIDFNIANANEPVKTLNAFEQAIRAGQAA